MSAPVAAPVTRTPDASPVRLVLLVAQREIATQLRSKAFLISTAVLLFGILAGIVGGSALSSRDENTMGTAIKVAVVPQTAGVAAGLASFVGPVPEADEAAARAAVEDGSVAAALLPDDGPAGVRVVALDTVPAGLVDALTTTPAVEVLNPATASEAMRYLVAFGFGIVFLFVSMLFGQTIAQNTVIEKQTRVVEILLSAVSARVLMAGKVVGNSVLALGQTAAIALVTLGGLKVTGQDEAFSLVGGPVGWFVVFFVFGFVLLAAMFAAAASLVSRVEDAGTVLQPVMLLVLIPYLAVILGGQNRTLMRVMSYIPFAAPVGMPVRVYLGDARWWEPPLSLVLLIVCAAAVVWLAALVYQRSVLRMGARVHLREVLGRRAGNR